MLRRGVERSDLTTRPPAERGSGEVLADISLSMVELYKESYGKGPTRARTYMSDDLVVCLLQGTLTAHERTLRDGGRGHAVTEQRETLQDVLRDQFVETIEALTGRKVITSISGLDLGTETDAQLFVLEPIGRDTGDEHDAVTAWAGQTRRQARLLQEEQAALRERQARLRDALPLPNPGLDGSRSASP